MLPAPPHGHLSAGITEITPNTPNHATVLPNHPTSQQPRLTSPCCSQPRCHSRGSPELFYSLPRAPSLCTAPTYPTGQLVGLPHCSRVSAGRVAGERPRHRLTLSRFKFYTSTELVAAAGNRRLLGFLWVWWFFFFSGLHCLF